MTSATPGSARHSSKTTPAGSRESKKSQIPPALMRRRVSQLVARATDLGRPMRRSDAYAAVLAWSTDADDTTADGWDSWLSRFNPTYAAAAHNIARGDA